MTGRPAIPRTRMDAPRIALIQKSDGILTWRKDMMTALAQAGIPAETFHFRASTVAERWEQARSGRRLLFNPATCRLLARRIAAFSPDLVLVLNHPGLPAPAGDALRAALRPGVPVVGWLCDQLDVFPAGFEATLDGVYFFDSACLPVLRDHYGTAARLDFLPLAACPDRYPCPDFPVASRRPWLVFAGNCTPSRQRFFREFRATGHRLDLFGPHAGNFPAVWHNRKLPSSTLGHLYRSHLLNLNLLQPGNTTHGLNLRAFEIPCAGGLATYPEVPDLNRCFLPNQEIFTYRTADDLAHLIDRLIANPDEAQAVTAAGHRRVLREHTFYHRLERIFRDWIGTSCLTEQPPDHHS